MCQQEVTLFYEHFAVLLTNLQAVYDPELIVVSGGVTERPAFYKELRGAVEKINELRAELAVETDFEVAAFKNDANLVGAVFHLTH